LVNYERYLVLLSASLSHTNTVKIFEFFVKLKSSLENIQVNVGVGESFKTDKRSASAAFRKFVDGRFITLLIQSKLRLQCFKLLLACQLFNQLN